MPRAEVLLKKSCRSSFKDQCKDVARVPGYAGLLEARQREWETHLEVEVVDGRKRSKAVVPQSEAGVVNLRCKSQRQEQRRCIHALGNVIQYPRDEEDVAIVDGAHLEEEKGRFRHGQWNN